jgi:DNA-binding LytR/AlgR family response regulator
MVKINFSEISYIESLGDYIKIHLENKTILTRETITNFEAKLPGNEFLRIHRSFIVAIAKINSFTKEYVEVNNKALTISRSYRKGVLNRLE